MSQVGMPRWVSMVLSQVTWCAAVSRGASARWAIQAESETENCAPRRP